MRSYVSKLFQLGIGARKLGSVAIESFLCPFALGDILEDNHGANFLVLFSDWRANILGRETGTVLAVEELVIGILNLRILVQPGAGCSKSVKNLILRFPHQFLDLPPRNLGRGWVDESSTPLEV